MRKNKLFIVGVYFIVFIGIAVISILQSKKHEISYLIEETNYINCNNISDINVIDSNNNGFSKIHRESDEIVNLLI